MKKLSLVGLLFLLASCSGGSKVAATVNGEPIYFKELDEAAKSELQKIDSQLYEVRRNVLDSVIEDKLLQKAAKDKGVTVEELLKQEVENKTAVPAEEEMKAMYEARKQKDSEPFETVKDDLRNYLLRQRQQMQRHQFLANLQKDAKIEVKLEAPRVEVAEGNSPSKGPENAPVKIIEFSDYECPFCGRARPTVNQIINTYGEKVRYTFRDFPLSFHKESFKAHEACHCAGDQNKYW
ncbi:MAG: thioredoxin domain-containing protein, partial [Deltaproteobacteria bacterium]|nr:thioredoxin domain-containing protein [Deltaproteobacteria bacterium]